MDERRREARVGLEQIAATSSSSGSTFELVPQRPAATRPGTGVRPARNADPPGTLDAVHDLPNMALQEESQRVRHDLEALRGEIVEIVQHYRLPRSEGRQVPGSGGQRRRQGHGDELLSLHAFRGVDILAPAAYIERRSNRSE